MSRRALPHALVLAALLGAAGCRFGAAPTGQAPAAGPTLRTGFSAEFKRSENGLAVWVKNDTGRPLTTMGTEIAWQEPTGREERRPTSGGVTWKPGEHTVTFFPPNSKPKKVRLVGTSRYGDGKTEVVQLDCPLGEP
jgi:hypothetical protein